MPRQESKAIAKNYLFTIALSTPKKKLLYPRDFFSPYEIISTLKKN